MKRKFFARIVVVLLLATMLFSVVATTVSAASDTNITAASETKVHGNTGQRRPYTKNLEEINKKLDALTPKEKTYFQKSVNNLKSAKTADQAASIAVSTLMEIATDPDNVNWKNVGIDAAAGIINLAASCFGFGGVAQAITGPLAGLLKDKSPSEIQLLQEHLDEQFEIVNQGIADIREDISDLSVSVDKSIADAVQALEDAIEAQSAGEKVYAFTFSGEGNFDYTLFKNYLYGTSDSTNELAKYAYYDKLSKAISNNGTDAEIEEYYNALYNSLTTIGNERMPYINVLRQYILEDEYGYSIQRYYYEWLSSNRKMLTDSGKDAEWEAMLFTLDVYKTMLYAEHSLAACDNYFLSKIYLEYGSNPSNDAFYKYTSPEGNVTYVKFSDIKKELNNLNNEEREHALVIQMIKDITYIFNMENSYMIKDVDGDFYTINNNDSSTFGQVRSGQTVYMNKLTDELCEMFGFDPQNFTYVWSIGEQNTGALEISDGISALSVTLCYNGTEIYTVDFEINNKDSFSGGSGTEDDPYLICDPSQFALIIMGEDGNGLHYQLVNDIDFNNVEQSPLGSVENAFEGMFDGNGNSISNLTIKSAPYTGLFAKINLNGIVKNLELDNINISGSQDGAADIFCGAVAGKNEGTIDNCHVKDSNITFTRITSKYEGSCITTNVGGIAGVCCGAESKIINCSVTSSVVRGEAHKTYKKGKNEENANTVNVGGITAYLADQAILKNCVVEGESSIFAYAGSKDNGGIKHAHVYARVAGITNNLGLGIWNYFESEETFNERIHNLYVSDEVEIDFAWWSGAEARDNYSGTTIRTIPSYRFGAGFLSPSITYTMPSRNELVFSTIRQTYEAEYEYTDAETNTTAYEYNEDFLKTKNLKIQVNGNEIEAYEIIGHYGLDTLKSDKIDGESCIVTILFTTVLNEETVILSVDIPIVVEKIDASELIIETLPQIEYERYEDVSLDGGKFVLVWEDGTKEYVIPEITSGNTNDFGSSQIVISYNGVSTTYAIAVKCLHEYVNSTVAPTCTTVGYTEAVCSKCNDRYIVDGSVIDEIEHTIVIKNAVTATCVAGSVGYTGDKYCTVCEELIEKGSVINVLQHEYEYLDGNSCKCKVCKDDKSTKAHEYTSVENDKSIIYSCATCGYSYTVEKKTTTDITRVVVGNSYGLVGSDNEIVVYIKMFNNPGITGVSFRIEYDDRLEYVRYERGELLSAASEFEVAQTNGVIGFVAASPDIYVADGNLLKLVFKLPDGAQVMDKYNISIAYTRKQFTGGQANAIDIVTMDGCITAVTHLPGDVNNDGFVDVLDTALVARYVAISNTKDSALMDAFLESQNYNFSEFYADVNLDGYVDLSDLVIMLQYFVGKNVQELTSNEFEVILNPNNGSLELDSIVVKCYDENGKRGTYPELPIPVRPGYRFDGWYLSFDVSDLEAERIQAGEDVYYNPTYLKQTLYAHWTEIYTIEYDVNAPANASSVSGSMEDSLYEYDEKKPLASNGFVITGWTFKGWATSPNGAVVYADGEEVSGLAHAGEVITLYAVWEANTYTIKFNNNKPTNASGIISEVMDNLNCVYDIEFTLTPVEYKLEGWTFKGWATSANGEIVYSNGERLNNLTTVNGHIITLYAIWEANSYTIQFNTNKPYNASAELIGNMSNIDCWYDVTFNLGSINYDLTGWTFRGWATSPNGSVVYNDNAEIKNLTSVDGKVISLYAVWEVNTYTIKFKNNKPSNASGVLSGTMDSVNCVYDTALTLELVDYSLVGWTFKGWATSASGNVEFKDGADIKNLTDVNGSTITLYAVWEAHSYNIQFNSNKPADASTELTGSMSNITCFYDTAFTLVENDYILEGWTFKGWATTANGEVVYSDIAELNNLTEINGKVITLYAVWGKHSYTVEYNPNKPNMASGTVSGTMEKTACTYDVLTLLSSNKYNLTGWTFKGWSNTPNGDVVYLDGAEIKNLTSEVDGNVVLYAVWDANTYTVKFDANKPTSSTSEVIGIMDDVTLDYDSGIDLTNNFTLEGWTFLGWATSANGTPIYNDKEIVTNITDENEEVVILYAIWSTKFYTVKYDANKPDCGCAVNGNMSDTNCSYDVPVTLKSNGYSILGHEFKGWATSPSGTVVYDDGTEIINLTAEENGVVTLYAVWGLNEYTIDYEENGGLNIGNTTYTIHNASSITITQAVYDSIYAEYMHFIGWYEDAAFANVFVNDLATNPRNITLYAKWDLCTVYNGMSTTPDIGDKRVIVDWSNATNTDVTAVRGNGVLSVANTTKELIIIGNPNLTYTNFSISLIDFAKDQELTIRFVNFNYISNVDGAIKPSETDNGMVLTIDVNGVCSINTSVTSGNIITGFVNTLNFIGDGEMTITAGNGLSGSGNGGKGGTAVTATNVIITMDGKLNVYGGNGGNAYDRPSGDNSGNCSNGRNGYTGGIGGDAFSVENLTIVSGTCLIIGGNGGEGGNASEGNDCIWHTHYGGSGGAGGSGGNAINAAILTVNDGGDVTATGGNGGNGGTRGGMHEEGDENAGSQGAGGAYGYAITSSCTQNVSENATTAINNGTTGSPGTGTNVC